MPRRPDIREVITQDLLRAVADAEKFGLVVEVRQEPLLPLAMGHCRTVVEVREKFKRAPT